MSLTKQTFREKVKLYWYELLYMFHLLSVVLCASVLGCATCYAAGSATANEVALKGGMSIIDGTFITAVFMGLSSVITAIGFLLWGRNYMNKHDAELRKNIANELTAKIVNDPLHVQKIPECISVQECNRKMNEMESRLCKVEANVATGFNQLLTKLDAMDRKSEDRSVALHRRVDTVAERTSTMMGEVGMIKDKMFAKRRS